MFDVPQFAIRACLYGVEPYEGENWCSQVVNRFHYLTNGKVLLCVLEATDPSRRIVYIRVSSNVDDYFQVKDIGEMLINEKLLRKATLKSDKYQGASKMVPKTKYPYLFPSFESIENGMMPSSVYINELLKHCITSIILFKPYFTYNGINLSD
ncbi:hypothetical protein JTB14_001179 [Gonioctena quinquepunctata]|nr:hypothetical protein JTB14_001179 [Gonioctena quinquepunctata]